MDMSEKEIGIKISKKIPMMRLEDALKLKPMDVLNDIEVLDKEGKNVHTGLLAIPQILDLMISHYKCQCCGECCCKYGGERDKGIVVSEKDIAAIAGFKKIRPRRIRRQYIKGQDSKMLLPKPCPFYKDKSCQIYPVRPFICRYYPLIGTVYEDYITFISDIPPQHGLPWINIEPSCIPGKELAFWSAMAFLATQIRYKFGIEPSKELVEAIPDDFAVSYQKAVEIMEDQLRKGEPLITVQY
jgi:Fe-S-cluster containining protein